MQKYADHKIRYDCPWGEPMDMSLKGARQTPGPIAEIYFCPCFQNSFLSSKRAQKFAEEGHNQRIFASLSYQNNVCCVNNLHM